MMGENEAVRARDAWAMVWGDGRASVYPGTADYAMLARWWLAEFEPLANVGRALEVGAGAMPLPSLCLAQHAPEAEIIAGDIRPAPAPPPPIRWANDVALDRLPFADATFDLFLGQFAFEYAEPVAAAAQARRVLRRGGRLRLVVHHHDSRMARYLADRIACLQAGAGVEATLAHPAAREVRRARLRRALRTLDPLIETYLRPPFQPDVVDDLLDLHRIVRGALAGETASEDDRLLLSQCAPALALAEAQRAASLSEEGIAALADNLRDAGFAEVRTAAIADERGPLAWGVGATAA